MEKKLSGHVRRLRTSLTIWGDELEASGGRLSAEMLAAEAMNSGARNSRNAIDHALGMVDHFRTSKAGMLKAYKDERGRRWRDDPRLAWELHRALDRYHDWAKERWNYGRHSEIYRSTLAALLEQERSSLNENVRRPAIDHFSKRFPLVWLLAGIVLGAVVNELLPHLTAAISPALALP